MRLLKPPIDSLRNYSESGSEEPDFQKAFSSYLPQLEIVALAINGIMEVSEIYDSSVNGREARLRWVNRHPEWSRGGETGRYASPNNLNSS